MKFGYVIGLMAVEAARRRFASCDPPYSNHASRNIEFSKNPTFRTSSKRVAAATELWFSFQAKFRYLLQVGKFG